MRATVQGLVALCAFSLGSASAADATGGARPVWLREYRVAPHCPDAESFGARVKERAAAASGGGRAIRLDVNIAPGGGGAFSGTIDVTDAASSPTRRVVTGGSCEEVATALGLIAAIALDTSQGGAEQTGTAASATPSRPSAPVASSHTNRGGPLDELERGALAFALAHGGASPDAAVGVGAAVALEWRRPERWQPALWLAGYRVTGDTLSVADGAARARFELLAAQLLLCPMRWPAAGRWGLRPCLELELGQLSGVSSGARLIGATRRSGLWASGGLGMRGDADVWGPLRVAVLAAGIVPLARHDFSFSPDTTLAFRVPALSWQAAGFIGVLF